MRRITSTAIVTAMALALAGCGETASESANLELSTTAISESEISNDATTATSESENSDSSALSSNEETGSASEDTNSEITTDQFIYKKKAISILDSNDRILNNLGAFNPELTVNADLQSMYVYGDYEITYNALKEDGVEYPYILDVETDSISTSRGIKVGSTKEEVISAYGEAEELKSGALNYSFDGFDIVFGLENGKVSNINYKNISTASKFDEWE